MIEKTAIISDIHGTFYEFQELLKLIDYKSKYVRVILCGDILDRAPYSVECVRLARELNLECVMGNHEKKYLKWLSNYRINPNIYARYPHYTQFSELDIKYIESMSYYIKVGNTIIVHAGLKPNLPLEQQSKDDVMYLRYTDANGKFLSIKKVLRDGVEASGAHFWTEFGPFGQYDVIYGHNVSSLTDIKIDRYDNGTAAYGIDTGCAFGGRLSCLILESKEVIQVQAKEIYYKPYSPGAI